MTVILVIFSLIIIRVWYLSEVLHDDRLQEALQPRRLTVREPAKRGTIRDRFNTPLAINRIQYQAGLICAELNQIPSIAWGKDENGNKVKVYKRKLYIQQLSEKLAQELELDPQRIEDLIYSKATFYHQVPYVLKENITEEQYFRLNMLARDWPGIYVWRSPKRFYPRGKVAGDIIGYMGAIDRQEYDRIVQELAELRRYLGDAETVELPDGYQTLEQVRQRYKDLEGKAYRANDTVGKAGIEQQFEQILRGFQGRTSYYSDARGNRLCQLPGARPPVSGERILLTISAELQQFAEELLIQNEGVRKIRFAKPGDTMEDPWVKGGAIVVMDPNTGELLALASHPRFDPNDFIQANTEQIHHWFETDRYISQLWHQKLPLERETFNINSGLIEIEQLEIDWEQYLNLILPKDNPVRKTIRRLSTVRNSVDLLRQAQRLLDICEEEKLGWVFHVLYQREHQFNETSPPPAHISAAIKERLRTHFLEVDQIVATMDQWFKDLPYHYDKLLLLDLCRVAVDPDRFSERLLKEVGDWTLKKYHQLNSGHFQIRELVRSIIFEEFHERYFLPWRATYGAEFLKEKRQLEKENKTYAKPYIDYFDKKEKQLFAQFWNQHQQRFILLFLLGGGILQTSSDYDPAVLNWHQELKAGAHSGNDWYRAYSVLQQNLQEKAPENALALLNTFRGFEDLTKPLFGSYRYLKKEGKEQKEKHLAAAFYPQHGFGNARSFAYRQATVQGSLFKLVTAYTAMIQRYRQIDDQHITLNELNPLIIEDRYYKKDGKQYLGTFSNGKAIPQFYKGGRLMRSVSRQIGTVDLLGAIETSSNPYFSLLAGDVLTDPGDLARTARLFSYGAKTGIELPLELKGRIPNDLDFNRTGLYAMANGQHSMIVTPLQTAVMLSAFSNSGYVLQPKIVHLTVGELPNRGEELSTWQTDYPFKNSLELIGIDFPLFIHTQEKQRQYLKKWPTQVMGKLQMPQEIRKLLLEGMRRVTSRLTNQGLGGLTQLYHNFPSAVSNLVGLKKELVGKTSTAESLENLNLDYYRGTQMFNHVWFGGIVFDKEIDPRGFLIKDQEGKPELVVVVFLKYGSFGREAAPLAAQIVNKWREIQQSQNSQHIANAHKVQVAGRGSK